MGFSFLHALEPDLLQETVDLFPSIIVVNSFEKKNKFRVLIGGEDGNQVVELEDEADVVFPEFRTLGTGQRSDLLAVKPDLSG
jgi:hypothetical protein